MLLTFGNVAPREVAPGATATVRRAGEASLPVSVQVARTLDPLVSHTTQIVVPDRADVSELLADVAQLWPLHSSQAPGWVLCDDEAALTAVREHFGLAVIPGPTMLFTNAGRDVVAAQVSGAGGTAVLKYMALTANATSPAAGDTTLTAEIATGGGGLVRAVAAYAHTGGTATYTLSKTFTANGSDTLPVTIAKIGVFDASSSGNMGFETLLSSTATLSASGDALTVTDTITLS
jgi:hypothetical protein